MSKLHLIYVPGLGDNKVTGQQFLVNTWKWWGVSAELFQTKWANGEAWEPKFERLLVRIDAATAKGKRVGLVGASAGATAVINAYQARQKVVGVVLIAGKINRPQAISGSTIRRNNAFGAAAQDAAVALEKLSTEQRSHILSRYAMFDPVVPARDSRVNGAHNQVVPTSGHAVTIGTQLFFGAPSFIRFLKRQ